MPDYSKGKIYRIVCNQTNEQYIGSTTQTLAQRLTTHKSTHSISRPSSSQQIIERGNYAIVLIDECPCENKNQFERRERYFIETMDCINKVIPTRTIKEYYEANKEQISEYHRAHYQANREQLAEKQHTYREANKEQISEYHRAHYQSNKERLLEQYREYYRANKEKIAERRRASRAAKRNNNLPNNI